MSGEVSFLQRLGVTLPASIEQPPHDVTCKTKTTGGHTRSCKVWAPARRAPAPTTDIEQVQPVKRTLFAPCAHADPTNEVRLGQEAGQEFEYVIYNATQPSIDAVNRQLAAQKAAEMKAAHEKAVAEAVAQCRMQETTASADAAAREKARVELLRELARCNAAQAERRRAEATREATRRAAEESAARAEFAETQREAEVAALRRARAAAAACRAANAQLAEQRRAERRREKYESNTVNKEKDNETQPQEGTSQVNIQQFDKVPELGDQLAAIEAERRAAQQAREAEVREFNRQLAARKRAEANAARRHECALVTTQSDNCSGGSLFHKSESANITMSREWQKKYYDELRRDALARQAERRSRTKAERDLERALMAQAERREAAEETARQAQRQAAAARLRAELDKQLAEKQHSEKEQDPQRKFGLAGVGCTSAAEPRVLLRCPVTGQLLPPQAFGIATHK